MSSSSRLYGQKPNKNVMLYIQGRMGIGEPPDENEDRPYLHQPQTPSPITTMNREPCNHHLTFESLHFLYLASPRLLEQATRVRAHVEGAISAHSLLYSLSAQFSHMGARNMPVPKHAQFQYKPSNCLFATSLICANGTGVALRRLSGQAPA
jgi:hypothetical protein